MGLAWTGDFSPLTVKLTLELGDVLWYLSELCTRLGIRLEDVAARNITKLADRASRGVLPGDGDLR